MKYGPVPSGLGRGKVTVIPRVSTSDGGIRSALISVLNGSLTALGVPFPATWALYTGCLSAQAVYILAAEATLKIELVRRKLLGCSGEHLPICLANISWAGSTVGPMIGRMP